MCIDCFGAVFFTEKRFSKSPNIMQTAQGWNCKILLTTNKNTAKVDNYLYLYEICMVKTLKIFCCFH